MSAVEEVSRSAAAFASKIGASAAGTWLVTSNIGSAVCPSLEAAVKAADQAYTRYGAPVSINPVRR